MKKKLLALYYRPPILGLPQNSYGQYNILKSAEEYFDIKILSFCSLPDRKEDDKYFKPNNSYLAKLINLIFRFRSPHLTHYFTKKMFDSFTKTLKEFKPDLLYVDNLVMMQYPLSIHPNIKILFYDDESQLFVKSKKIRKRLTEKIKNIGLVKEELKSLNIAETTFCITSEETNFLNSLGYNSVLTLPYSVDVEHFYYNWKPPINFTVLFVGDFSHYPNREAARIISSKISPAFSGLNIQFIIVGRNINRIKKYLSQKIITYENVDDVRPFYWNNSLFIAPLFSGGGMRIKILEAASCGIPILMSPLANLGVNLENAKDAFIEDSISGIIQLIKRIYKSDRSDQLDVSLNANKKVKSHFSLSEMNKLYNDIFNEIL